MEKENIISTNFMMTNRDIIAEFGEDSAVMLGELYGRMNYFRKRNELKFGYFFVIHFFKSNNIRKLCFQMF